MGSWARIYSFLTTPNGAEVGILFFFPFSLLSDRWKSVGLDYNIWCARYCSTSRRQGCWGAPQKKEQGLVWVVSVVWILFGVKVFFSPGGPFVLMLRSDCVIALALFGELGIGAPALVLDLGAALHHPMIHIIPSQHLGETPR